MYFGIMYLGGCDGTDIWKCLEICIGKGVL